LTKAEFSKKKEFFVIYGSACRSCQSSSISSVIPRANIYFLVIRNTSPQMKASIPEGKTAPQGLKIKQIIWLLFWAVCGVAPVFTYPSWVNNRGTEFEGTDPWSYFLMNYVFPDYSKALSTLPLWGKVIFNIGLIIPFGMFHTIAAQASVHKLLNKMIPAPAIRAFYMIGSSFFMIVVRHFFIPTGVDFHLCPTQALIYGYPACHLIGMIVSTIAGIPQFPLVLRIGVGEFSGFTQLYTWSVPKRTEGTPKLITSGLYKYVRHPMYSLTWFGVILTPMLDLDRVCTAASYLIYLIFAIPVEERKLIAQFGNDYVEYRKRVAAIIPFVF
jgi:protein-S-isoprenylcysteine O-methyltransferase Ste14